MQTSERLPRPPGAIDRPGVIDHYQAQYEKEGKLITDAYSLPTGDPNIHELKIEWIWIKDRDALLKDQKL